MKKPLVIGASGFVGGHLARTLLTQGFAVRCLARNPGSVATLAEAGCEVVAGDISDPASLMAASDGIDAVAVSIHTLSPQKMQAGGFMDIETAGLRNIVEACKARGVRRLVYVTSLGIERDSPSLWIRGRWRIEQDLIHGGLDATVIRPGQIVGRGGRGFGMTVAQARSRLAIVLGDGGTRMRHIAVDDLIYYLIGVLGEPRAFGQCFDVGGDETLSADAMIDAVAEVLGRRAPRKLHVPLWMLGALAPLIERMTKSPRGAIADVAEALKFEFVGDPTPIRAILPRPLLSYRDAVAKALNIEKET